MLWLGIDVGGTKTALAFGDEHGQVRAHERWPTTTSPDPVADLRAMAERARGLAAAEGIAWSEVQGVGVSVPGPLDPASGMVLNPPNLPGWDRAPVRETLTDALALPVAVENDANAAALAEWRFGAGRGFEHVVYLTMSTGVGGGLVLGGRLHRGVLSSAGEVGHMPLVWDGAPCACGLRGCLEAYVGGASWARRLAAVTPARSRVAALAAAAGRPPRPEDVVGAAREGDDFALAEMARWNELLARGLVQLVFVLAPQIFVLGTIAVAAGETLCLGPVRERVRERVWPFLGQDLRVEAAQLGERLPQLAGLVVALDAFAG